MDQFTDLASDPQPKQTGNSTIHQAGSSNAAAEIAIDESAIHMPQLVVQSQD